MAGDSRIQIQVVLPYKQQPRQNPRIRAWLERGFRIAHLQRISDQEALVTLDPPSPAPPS